MKLFKYLPLLLFISCMPQENNFSEYIDMIGKKAQDIYTIENEYTKTYIINGKDISEITIKLMVDNDEIVQTCFISYIFNDINDSIKYYRKISNINKKKWQFIELISSFKNTTGELFHWNGFYLGIYEPVYFSVPIVISNNREVFYKDSFYDGNIGNPFVQTFSELNKNVPEMLHSIEYYKKEIIDYRNMFDERQYISYISEVKNFYPGLLSILVCWNDQLKGYIYELYTFNENQKIVGKYLVGYGPFLNNYWNVLMDKLPGTKIGREFISIGDFNNDGINEILSFSFYTNTGYVFTIFGYNTFENDIIHLCLVPVYINFESPFSSVEYIENGFKIIEVVDNDSFDLTWNEYIWNNNSMKYLKK